MSVLAILPASSSSIDLFVLPEGGTSDQFGEAPTATFEIPGSPGPKSKTLSFLPLNNGKLLAYSGSYYPWGYNAIFLAVFDRNDGFEFDIVIPTLDNVVTSSVVVLPNNDVLFKTDARVYKWQYGATELALLLSTTGTQYISFFSDGSGFCWWNYTSNQLILYDLLGEDYSFVDVPADIRLWNWMEVVDPTCIPYRESTAGFAPFTHGVYNLNTDIYTPLFVTSVEYARLLSVSDKSGTTLISTNNDGDFLTAFRFSNGIMLYSLPVSGTMNFNRGYEYNSTLSSTAFTEAPSGE
jgi:hypothetical protein